MSTPCARAAVSDLIAAFDLGHDLDVLLESKQAGEGAANHALVLRDQDADHLAEHRQCQAEAKPALRPRPCVECPLQAARPLREPHQARAVAVALRRGRPRRPRSVVRRR